MFGQQVLNRRDFLKLLALVPAIYLAKTSSNMFQLPGSSKGPGVIIIVLDALAATNLSLYGYSRKTSPNLERFASRSTVFHNHYSTSNFTSSGTASMLTGMYPWTHRAFHYEGQVLPAKVDMNLFRYWGDAAFRLGFTQNSWADILLNQFSPWLDKHVDLRMFSLNKKPLLASLFRNDPITAFNALDSYVLELEPGYSASSLLALARKVQLWRKKDVLDKEMSVNYPYGIPKTLNDLDINFLLEDLFDGLMELIHSLPSSALSYLHVYPPHFPYTPRAEFLGMFKGERPRAEAPPAYFVTDIKEDVKVEGEVQRDLYDSYIATVDFEFGRLLDFMEQEGIFDKNYVVVTSDHGDLFERGVIGHNNIYLYEPLIHVPLVVSSPGQRERSDVFSPTSSVDLVPTLLNLTGRSVSAACEGVLLPGLGGVEDGYRSIYSIDAKNNSVRGPITNATMSLRKGRYKLIGYYGYGKYPDGYELFDLENDPAELDDLVGDNPGILSEMRMEMNNKIRDFNRI